MEDGRNVHELGVYVPIHDCADALLWSMIGGADRSKPAAKLFDLLDRDTSLIGKTMAGLLGLLSNWSVGGPLRVPWMILDMLGAPLEDQAGGLVWPNKRSV